MPPPAKEAPRGGFLLSLTQLVFRPTKPTEQGPPGNKLPCTLQRGIFAIGSDVVVEGLMKCPAAWLMTLPNLSRYILFRSFQIFSLKRACRHPSNPRCPVPLNTVILKYITQIIQQIFGNSQIMKTIDLSFNHKFM